MHQQSRLPPKLSSPATSPQTNPTRANNPRDALATTGRARSGSEVAGQEVGVGPESGNNVTSGPTKESIKKLDQIIQNFYYKAAVLILQSRINVTPSPGNKKAEGRKVNRWFQIETDDIDDFRDELRVWKTCGGFENRPPPMIIETYVDASRLSSNQSLVMVDDNGKRWDVLEALNSSDSWSEGGPRQGQTRNTQVVLERWRIELKCLSNELADDFGPVLPTIYKRSIVFFRSLYVAARVMPCWKYSQQAMAKGIHPALEVKCRVLTSATDIKGGIDPLRQPLTDGREPVVSDYMFGDLEVPVGRFYASVAFRNECSFRVDDSESLLSSRFMGVDENYFKPSVPQRRDNVRTDPFAEVGSLPSQRHGRGGLPDQQQTYGSLSTFHGVGALSTSPISALKAVRPLGSDTSSPAGSVPASLEPEPPHSLPIGGHSSARPTLRNLDTPGRRPSISFHPFKAGSLSGSPRIHDPEPPSSPQSLSRPSILGGVSQPRNRSSLTAGMAASLRAAPPPAAESPVVGSPKPASRYSSSFQHRRNRPSFGGNSKAGDDDQVSSGKQSLSSSAQPGSGLLAEAGGAASSGSFQTDDDNISEFLKALDSKKTLQSFDPNHKKGESTARRTAAQLSKFQLMRESNNALTESMTSSVNLQRSSSSSSRQLANVPSMVNPASMSASSSPGKPLSPHTPHTPAIPSRLSENSIIDYHGQAQTARPPPDIVTTTEESSEPISQESGTTAIDIPLSPRLPRLHQPNNDRRASSVAQQNRGTAADEEDADLPPFGGGGHRSISLGADERDNPPTLSVLLGRNNTANANVSGSPGSGGSLALRPAADIRSAGTEREEKSDSEIRPSLRMRYHPGRGRPTPPRGSFSGTGYGSVLARGVVPAGEEADDEPLVFDLSELVREPGRRSLEEAGGGGNSGSGSGTEREKERGGYDSNRGSRRW